jgi:hypothetical protein
MEQLACTMHQLTLRKTELLTLTVCDAAQGQGAEGEAGSPEGHVKGGAPKVGPVKYN